MVLGSASLGSAHFKQNLCLCLANCPLACQGNSVPPSPCFRLHPISARQAVATSSAFASIRVNLVPPLRKLAGLFFHPFFNASSSPRSAVRVSNRHPITACKATSTTPGRRENWFCGEGQGWQEVRGVRLERRRTRRPMCRKLSGRAEPQAADSSSKTTSEAELPGQMQRGALAGVKRSQCLVRLFRVGMNFQPVGRSCCPMAN